jgi:26S proteasome regulatory subunit T1
MSASLASFSECARYMTPEAISSFLDTAITSRIGVRLIAEQHIALSKSLMEPRTHDQHRIGVVDLECSPERLIRMCASFVGSLSDASIGASPELIIDGVVDATFA